MQLNPDYYPHIDKAQVTGRRPAAMARRIIEAIHTDELNGGSDLAKPEKLPEEALFTAMHTCAHRATAGRTGGGRADHRTLWAKRWSKIRGFIVKRNLGLVYSTLTRVSSATYGLDQDELRSEGLYALLRAVERFDPGRGFRFSTYACTIIRRALLNRAQQERRYHRRFPVQHDEAFERPDRRDEAGELAVERLRKILQGNAGELTGRESRVLAERFPIDRRKRPTFAQLGAVIGVSKERVRQIQRSALDKLRGALEADPALH